MNEAKRRIRWFLIPFSICIAVYFGGSYFFAGEIIDFKKRNLEEDRKNEKISGFSDFNLSEPEDHLFTNQEGLKFKAWYFPNSPKRCGVLLLHGFTGTRWGVMKYAPIFRKLGCEIFAYDHRKHGESEGRFGTFGYYEKYDFLEALEYFEKISGIAPERIGVLGESMGAATAIQGLALANKQYAFLIAESSYKDLDSIIGKKAVDIYGQWVKAFIPMAYWIAEFRADFHIEDVSPMKSVASLRIPVLFIHSDADDYTPSSHSREIYENTGSPIKEIVITDWNSGHALSINDDYERFEKIVISFLRRHSLL